MIFSGRTEKQAVQDAQMKARTPPPFTRVPSRRYQRRIIEGTIGSKNKPSIAYFDGYLLTLSFQLILSANSVETTTIHTRKLSIFQYHSLPKRRFYQICCCRINNIAFKFREPISSNLQDDISRTKASLRFAKEHKKCTVVPTTLQRSLQQFHSTQSAFRSIGRRSISFVLSRQSELYGFTEKVRKVLTPKIPREY